jgi:large subunit ribosomal protein L29
MKNTEIKALNLEEIKERIATEKENLQKLKFAHSITPLEDPMRIKKSRRLLAQLLTELRAKELVNA